MSKTILLALLGLALAACAQPADQEDQLLIDDEHQAASHDDDAGECRDRGEFDIAVFAVEILPILTGDLDLNEADEQPNTGCTRGPCHVSPRPDGFQVNPADPVDANLERFACFVDLERPKRSQVLLCPTDDDRCIRHPHPGAEVFDGPDDLNYRRILAYIRASR